MGTSSILTMVRQVSFLTGLAGMGEIRTLFAAEASRAEESVLTAYTVQLRRGQSSNRAQS